MQRIESYKDQLDRSSLLRIGDEAYRQLEDSENEQLLLAGVLLREEVDEQIRRRLKLPTFRKWKAQFTALRRAQREASRWGIDAAGPVGRLVDRIEPFDLAVVLGGKSAETATYLLAAHDAAVLFLSPDLGLVHVVEATLESESLGSQARAYLMRNGRWTPPELDDAPVQLVIIDAAALGSEDLAEPGHLLAALQQRTAPGGVHVLLAGEGGLAPDAWLVYYEGWQRDPSRGRHRGMPDRPGLTLIRPTDEQRAAGSEGGNA